MIVSRLLPLLRLVLVMLVTAGLLPAAPAMAQSLRGSSASLDRQNLQARRHDYSYLARDRDVARFVDAGLLVPVEGGAHYQLTGVAFRVARPEVRLFIERLSADYARTCGTPLVVTSLTRPKTRQPANASARSVHPTGMAVDLRVPAGAACRRWLESRLLALEGRGVLDVTLERSPLHYHVAVFPDPYLAYVATTTGRPAKTPARAAVATAGRPSPAPAHTVGRGDTLWRIAQTYDTTPAAIRRANRLVSSAIRPGQRLVIPTSSGD